MEIIYPEASTTKQRIQALMTRHPTEAHEALEALGFRKSQHFPGKLAIAAKLPEIKKLGRDMGMEQAGKLFASCLAADLPEIFGPVLESTMCKGGSLEQALKLVAGEKAVVDQINAGLLSRRPQVPSPMPKQPMFPYS